MREMQRRNFIKRSSALALTGTLSVADTFANSKKIITDKDPAASDREYWAALLYKIASPVLSNMARGNLRKNMPVELSPAWDGRDKNLAYMEAFGRLMAGLAPWLSLPDDATGESKLRKELREQSLQSFVNSVDPANPDYLLWNKEAQPLVDAAFIAHAFLRSPTALWGSLDNVTKENFIKEFKGLRRVKPGDNNWVLFAAMIETFLLFIDEQYDNERIDTAINKINRWYAGDGWYKTGNIFILIITTAT